MRLTQKMQEQGGKPYGVFGILIGQLMNTLHGNIHQWGLQHLTIQDNFVSLDIGCGGGNTLKAIINRATAGKTCGLDHSPEMVILSRKMNRHAIRKGLVEIDQGSVSDLPYRDRQFDLITAFETIQFWPDPGNDLKEVIRVLKPNGTFLIVNRYPPENSKWSQFLKIKNSTEYNKKLKSAGFDKINMDCTRKGWICISARRDHAPSAA